jgi:hypothetical protein
MRSIHTVEMALYDEHSPARCGPGGSRRRGCPPAAATPAGPRRRARAPRWSPSPSAPLRPPTAASATERQENISSCPSAGDGPGPEMRGSMKEVPSHGMAAAELAGDCAMVASSRGSYGFSRLRAWRRSARGAGLFSLFARMGPWSPAGRAGFLHNAAVPWRRR